MFHEGDIVEAQLMLMIVPLKGSQFKMIAVLCGLTLLDSMYSWVSNSALHISAWTYQ